MADTNISTDDSVRADVIVLRAPQAGSAAVPVTLNNVTTRVATVRGAVVAMVQDGSNVITLPIATFSALNPQHPLSTQVQDVISPSHRNMMIGGAVACLIVGAIIGRVTKG